MVIVGTYELELKVETTVKTKSPAANVFVVSILSRATATYAMTSRSTKSKWSGVKSLVVYIVLRADREITKVKTTIFFLSVDGFRSEINVPIRLKTNSAIPFARPAKMAKSK